MRMKLHIDSTIGDTYIYPIYDLDYAALSALPNFTTTIAPTTAEGYTINKWYVENNTGALTDGIPAIVPRFPEQTGNILPERFIYDEEIGGIKYLENWFDSECWQVLTTQPSDWDTNMNYVKIHDTSGVYRYVIGKIASRTDAFVANQCYKDLKKICCRKFFTDKGGHFAVYKCGAYERTARITCQWACGRPPMKWEDTTTAIQKNYMFVSDKTDGIFNSSFYISRTTTDAAAGEAYNSNFVFVHYTLSGVEYYGVAEILYSGWEDNAFPVRIMVCGIDSSFWGDNVIPGGGGGGNWGSDTVIGGGDGTWTFSSDSRGDGNGDTTEAIATERRTALQSFFSSAHGYQLHQILPNDIQNIFGLLYSNDFISRYTTSLYNPLSAVVSLHLLPQRLCDPQQTTTALTLSGYDVSANLPTPKNFPVVATIHSEHIGKVDIDATDTFLDYAPYTRAYLHLPYIGVLEIDINAIAAGSIAVDYITDAMTGNCAAYVWCSDRDGVHTIKYCATGNCAYSLPMFAASQDGAAIGKIVNSSLGLAMSAITGNANAALASVGGIAGGLFDAATTQRNTQIAGSFGGNPGLITDTVCWLEIVRPVWCNPEHYQLLDGVPSMLSGSIAAYNEQGDPYQGFLKVIDLDTDGIQATDDELTEIETILKSGIFVNEE